MAAKHYTGTWASVQTHTVPKWYDDAKFGIFIHWGLIIRKCQPIRLIRSLFNYFLCNF